MPKNTGHGTRLGKVTAQVRSNAVSETWLRRDVVSDRFESVKSAGGAFKGARKAR